MRVAVPGAEREKASAHHYALQVFYRMYYCTACPAETLLELESTGVPQGTDRRKGLIAVIPTCLLPYPLTEPTAQ